MLKREEIARIKEMYPKGTPIRLYSMEGEQSVPPGSRGVVDHVDDIGQIHMKWENGSCLALNIEVDRFDIITQQDDISEKKEQEFIDKVNEILDKTDFLLLNMSCNTENTSYAAETLLAMHQAFEEVYGEGYVDEKYGMVMMPAVVKGTESGIKALALVTLDLESSGEHWGTTFLTPGGPLVQGNAELTEEQKRAIREYYIPYDYWYTPLVERDHHVNFTDMPETVANIRRLVDESLVAGEVQQMDLYTEMAEFSFLTKYIFGTGIEEIDINSWKDIEVQYSDGRCEKMEEHFESPEHAINVIRRMLHVSGIVLDNASPAVLGHLSKNIRIAVLKTPLVDEDVGIAASIRIVNPQSLKKSDFVDGGTATDEMLDFLAECLRYGISICVAGATSSGKTTLAGWLLTTIPDNKRIFTIENGSRELALVREKDGKVTNSVIHTLTRFSENEKQNIDQDMLLDMALRFNPEIICVGEMRSSEAYTAQESARTGHTVLTTIHSNSCESTYSRMRTLCKRKYDMDDEVLMDLVTEAFPIVVFTKQLENKKRRLMEIMECEITPDGKRHFNSLFRYEITENRVEGDKFIINGTHKKVCGISESLKKRFLENGMPREVLNKITGGGASVC